MTHSRRDFGSLALALLATRKADAQSQSPTLKSEMYRFEDRAAPLARSFAHPIFNGELHSGFAVELHETELPAGEVPHPPHHHVHEEVILIREGTMEVTISGKSVRMSPGSVAFVASNEDTGGAMSGRPQPGTFYSPWVRIGIIVRTQAAFHGSAGFSSAERLFEKFRLSRQSLGSFPGKPSNSVVDRCAIQMCLGHHFRFDPTGEPLVVPV
jgi:quercetin dioxygenase-like cupin family protein